MSKLKLSLTFYNEDGEGFELRANSGNFTGDLNAVPALCAKMVENKLNTLLPSEGADNACRTEYEDQIAVLKEELEAVNAENIVTATKLRKLEREDSAEVKVPSRKAVVSKKRGTRLLGG